MCVDAAISKLDDSISSADVIASGVFGVCRAILDIPELKTLASDPLAMEASLKPNILAKILEQRHQSLAGTSIEGHCECPVRCAQLEFVAIQPKRGG